MSLASSIAAKDFMLKKRLKMARMQEPPEVVVGKNLKNALYLSIGMGAALFMLIDKAGGPLIVVPIAVILMFWVFYNFLMMKIKAKVIRLQKDVDKDVLFAGRYLLVKLNSGQPLINAIIDASRSYGVANTYFKEIVREIELGKPLEKALQEASENSPSEKFRKILFQISNALRIGIDVTDFLEATLNEIADQQIIEIKRYGKKLSSVTLFYMLGGVVLPSLGLTILIVVSSLAGISIDMNAFFVILFFLTALQYIFLIVYRAIRPNINI